MLKFEPYRPVDGPTVFLYSLYSVADFADVSSQVEWAGMVLANACGAVARRLRRSGSGLVWPYAG